MTAVAALFVSRLGFTNPERMDESFSWASLPPLHARFVGALHLFGGVHLLACATARHTPGCGSRRWPSSCSRARCWP